MEAQEGASTKLVAVESQERSYTTASGTCVRSPVESFPRSWTSFSFRLKFERAGWERGLGRL